jgi:hypothetical protein
MTRPVWRRRTWRRRATSAAREGLRELRRGDREPGGLQACRRRRRRPGELDQRERIAGGLDEDASAQDRVEVGRPAIQQLGGRRRAQSLHVERPEPCIVERGRATRAHGGDHRQRLAVQPPGDERERVQSRAIEPVRVIHDEQDRPGRGRRLTQELEGGESDSEGIRLELLAGAEGDVQRPPLRGRQETGVSHDGEQQLVQPGEPELGLRLHSRGAQGPAAGGLDAVARGAQQRGLADPGRAPQDQRSAARREAVHHRRDEQEFDLAPDQVAAGHRPSIVTRCSGAQMGSRRRWWSSWTCPGFRPIRSTSCG